MTLAFQILGAICAILILAAIILGLWYSIGELREKRAQRIRAQAFTAACRELGNYIGATSHWFGESPDAALAIEAIGRYLCDNGLIDANQAREYWRREKAKRAPAPAEKGGAA